MQIFKEFMHSEEHNASIEESISNGASQLHNSDYKNPQI